MSSSDEYFSAEEGEIEAEVRSPQEEFVLWRAVDGTVWMLPCYYRPDRDLCSINVEGIERRCGATTSKDSTTHTTHSGADANSCSP